MTRVAIDWRLIRYSEIEQTHYFYDPSHPTTIQFSPRGEWESWDVRWVRQNTHDPEVRRIAEEAEERLSHGPAYGYQAWPGSSEPNGSERPMLPSLQSAQSTPPPISPAATSPIFAPGHFTQPALQQPYLPTYTPPSIPAPVPGPPSTAHFPLSAHVPTHVPPAHWPPEPSPAVPNPAVPHPAAPNGDPHLPNHGFPASYRTDTPPDPLPFSNNKLAKIILSMDGDGIRGLSAVLIVESLVNAICSKLQRRVDPHQIFDLICGVSTTGGLAIMIGRMRMRVHRARAAYVKIAKAMFQDKWRFYASNYVHPSLQPPEGPGLEQCVNELVMAETGTLNETFFDNRRDSTNVFVIATKVDIGFNQPAILRSYPTRRMAGPEVPATLTTSQALLATLTAPRYTNPSPHGPPNRRALIAPGLVDYGTAKNNPIRDAFYECKKLYSYTNDTMVVISIGSGAGVNADEVKELAHSVEERSSEARVVEEKFVVDNGGLIAQGWLKYFRFEVEGLEGVGLDEAAHVEEVVRRTTEYLARPEVGERLYECRDAVCGVLMGDRRGWPELERWEN